MVQGQLDKALVHLQKALLIDRKTLSQAVEKREAILNTSNEDNSEEIKKTHSQPVDTAQEYVALDLHNLARLYVDRGQLSEAQECETEAIELDRQRYANGFSSAIPDLGTIAEILMRQVNVSLAAK